MRGLGRDSKLLMGAWPTQHARSPRQGSEREGLEPVAIAQVCPPQPFVPIENGRGKPPAPSPRERPCTQKGEDVLHCGLSEQKKRKAKGKHRGSGRSASPAVFLVGWGHLPGTRMHLKTWLLFAPVLLLDLAPVAYP